MQRRQVGYGQLRTRAPRYKRERSPGIVLCWDACRVWSLRTLHSIPPAMKLLRRRRASSASAFPIGTPKALNANASRKSAGSVTARSGAQDARAASASSTPTRPQPLSLQGTCWNGALGRIRRHRRRPHQHRLRYGIGSGALTSPAIIGSYARRSPPAALLRPALLPQRPKTSILRRKVV
jgi:hypothetical protein